jgi:hypothetical protein
MAGIDVPPRPPGQEQTWLSSAAKPATTAAQLRRPLAILRRMMGDDGAFARYLSAHVGLADVSVRRLLFAEFCLFADLPNAQMIAAVFEFTAEDVTANDNLAFTDACRNAWSSPEIAEWLYREFRLTADVVRAEANFAARLACACGSHRTVKWLVRTVGLTAADFVCPDVHGHTAVGSAFVAGHYRIVRWLFVWFGASAFGAPASVAAALARPQRKINNTLTFGQFLRVCPELLRWFIGRRADGGLGGAIGFHDWNALVDLAVAAGLPIDAYLASQCAPAATPLPTPPTPPPPASRTETVTH